MLLLVPNVALPDEHTSMMNGLRHAILEDNGLKAALQEVLNSERKHIIKLVLALAKKTIAVHAAQECLALKDTAGILLIEGEQLPCSISDAAEGILHTPQLTLASQAILTHQFQLSIKALLLIRTPWLLESLTICVRHIIGMSKINNDSIVGMNKIHNDEILSISIQQNTAALK